MEPIYILLLFYISCLVFNHLILYIDWLKNSKVGSTLGDMYQYYTKFNFVNTYIFIFVIWIPIFNIVPIIVMIIILFNKIFSHIKIR